MARVTQRIKVRVLKTSSKNPMKTCPKCNGTGKVKK